MLFHVQEAAQDAAESVAAESETAAEMAERLLWAHGPAVLYAAVIMLVGWWVARLVRGIVRRVMTRRKIEPTLVGFLASLTFALVMTMVVISALGQLGIPTTSFITIVGAAGLAVAFALQGSLANFAAGVMLIFFRPFKAGDFVDAAGITGTVLEIQIFNTVLKTPDNKRIIVPNSAITSGNIVNFSAHDTRRVDLVFGIGYGDDVKKAKALFERLLREDERVLAEPAPVVKVSALADSSVNFIVRPWVKSTDYWDVTWDLTEKVKLELDANGITIPFPQRDVHVHQVA